MMARLPTSAALALLLRAAAALDNGLGRTPGMGWNSDYCSNCSTKYPPYLLRAGASPSVQNEAWVKHMADHVHTVKYPLASDQSQSQTMQELGYLFINIVRPPAPWPLLSPSLRSPRAQSRAAAGCDLLGRELGRAQPLFLRRPGAGPASLPVRAQPHRLIRPRPRPQVRPLSAPSPSPAFPLRLPAEGPDAEMLLSRRRSRHAGLRPRAGAARARDARRALARQEQNRLVQKRLMLCGPPFPLLPSSARTISPPELRG